MGRGVLRGVQRGVVRGIKHAGELLFGGAEETTLTVAISDSVDPVISAVNFNYSVVVTNTGSITATNVSCVVVLDSSLTFVSGSGTGWTVNHVSGTVTCTRASLTVGAAPTIPITVTTADATSTETTTADADADNAPPATQDSETTVVNLVDRDATATAERYPSSATQWTNWRAYQVAIGTANYPDIQPDGLYLCQEASGNLTDSIGGVTLTANATPLYSQAVTGLTRTGVGFNQTVNQRFVAGAGVGPNPATTSVFWMWVIKFVLPGGVRLFMGVSGNAAGFDGRCNSTPRLQSVITVGGTVTGTTNPTTPAWMPVGQLYDRAGSRASLYSGQEILTNTYNSGVADGNKGLGAVTAATSANCTIVYGIRFDGSKAEGLSDANIKALWQALGHTVSW